MGSLLNIGVVTKPEVELAVSSIDKSLKLYPTASS
jgi:hypothetical protein